MEFITNYINPEKEPNYNHSRLVAFQGNTGWHGQGYHVEATLLPLFPDDQAFIKLAKVAKDEVVYRYSTSNMFYGEQHLIKINPLTGRAFLLSEDAIECGEVEFQSKGFKLDYLNILS